MKREAIGCTKMKRLCRFLQVHQYEAVGILESLWDLTAKEAPQGDIGKLSDEDIALGIDYPHDEAKLINALIDSKWLDRDETCRLIIHDWHEHSEDAVDMKLARNGKFYASGQQPRMKRLTEKEKKLLCARFGYFVRTNLDPEHTENQFVQDAHTKGDFLALPKPLYPKPVNHKPEEKPNVDLTIDAQAGFSLEAPNGATKPSVGKHGLNVQQTAWFSEFWAFYWRKVCRPAAEEKFGQKVKSQAVFEKVLQAIKAQTPEMMNREPKNRPHAATWLHNERWNDEVYEPMPAPRKGANGVAPPIASDQDRAQLLRRYGKAL